MRFTSSNHYIAIAQGSITHTNTHTNMELSTYWTPLEDKVDLSNTPPRPCDDEEEGRQKESGVRERKVRLIDPGALAVS